MENIIHHSFKKIDGDVVVGIDEAGRGPVIGYLVYGAVISQPSCLSSVSWHDSKTMNVHSREEQFRMIESSMSFIYNAIHPQYITENMLFRGKNLNTISFEAVFDMLDVVYRSYKVSKVFVDTVGDPAKYKALLEKRYGPGFVVEQKADSKYKVVSGASIVAKVVRDNLLKNLGLGCGSGYPGDPLTRAWLKRNHNPVFGYPSVVRFSWATVDEFLPKRRARKMKGTFSGLYRTDQ